MALNPSIRKVIPASLPQATATYDFFDIAEGTGIQNFYAGQSISSGALIHTGFLTTDSSMLSVKTSEKRHDVAGFGSDVDYDVLFNLPKTIKGNVRITYSQGVNRDVGTPAISLVFRLYKVSNGVETIIGSKAEGTETSRGIAGQESDQHNLLIVAPKTHFKRGDTLRLNVQMYGIVGAAVNTIGYGCDPSNRTDIVDASGSIVISSGETTQLKVGVPFVIDI